MKIVWALLCNRIELKPNSELNIYAEFERAYRQSFPFTAASFCLVARFSRDRDPVGETVRNPPAIRIIIEAPNGDIICDQPAQFDQQSDRIICEVKDQRFPAPGKYTFRITENDRDIHSLSFRLMLEKGIH